MCSRMDRPIFEIRSDEQQNVLENVCEKQQERDQERSAVEALRRQKVTLISERAQLGQSLGEAASVRSAATLQQNTPSAILQEKGP